MLTICALGQTTSGCDISRYQDVNGHPFDFNHAIAMGLAFCFIKATEGAFRTDATFVEHWAASKEAGLLRGAYHYFHPREDAAAQAELFLKTVGLTLGALPCALDWESTDGVPTMADRNDALIWLKIVEERTGKVPFIYGSPYFLLQVISGDPRFAKYPLWIAHPGARCPLIPAPFQNWVIWQNSWANGLDKDTFNGTLQQLQALAA